MQRGYVLLLSLIVLVSGGLLSLMATLPQQHTGAMLQSGFELADAKLALISYAVSYPDLYGPAGAGPGHLPCADTDGPSTLNSRVADGPNPPCGKASLSIGRLARQVSLASHRYAFDVHDERRLWYAVASEFINNPVNRIINPLSSGPLRVQGQNDVVAVLFNPDKALSDKQIMTRVHAIINRVSVGRQSYGETTAGKFLAGDRSVEMVATITAKELRLPVMRRVGDWLQDMLNSAARLRCGGIEFCKPYDIFEPDCEVSIEPLMYWLAESRLTDRFRCQQGESSDVSGARLVLQGIRLPSHWLVRNKWPEFVVLQIDPTCVAALLADCVFRLNHIVEGETQMQFSLLPTDWR